MQNHQTALDMYALQRATENWLNWDRNPKTKKEIEDLVEKKDNNYLSELLLCRLEFGTAGLRGRMGAGFSKMNELVVIQTAQGLLKYLKENFRNLKCAGIVIGYDGRHNSKRFAELSATVFLASSVKVYLFSDLCPTPLIPFAILQLNCVAGIMVTASHNPKEDNGLKVYWENGAQIIPPHDIGIAEAIIEESQPRLSSWDTSIITSSLRADGLEDMKNLYLSRLPTKGDIFPINKIAYTAMHGVGWSMVKSAFAKAGFPEPLPALEQINPDPEFPTVPYPNPEEGENALHLVMNTAANNNLSVCFANDPDADRLAVAEFHNDKWRVFTGNEIGSMLAWWLIQCYFFIPTPNVLFSDYSKIHLISSTVSSQILRSMANVHGFTFHETLTGFKWMGNLASNIKKNGETVLFAFEEAIGFMCGTEVLDKDGVSAAVKMAELVGWLEKQEMNLSALLEQIHQKYGFHKSIDSYFFCYDTAVINSIFARLRNFYSRSNKSYPMNLKRGELNVVSVRDLTTGYDSSRRDKKAILPSSASTQMITFKFPKGITVTLRASGTEPKLKYYSEIHGPLLIIDRKAYYTRLLQEVVDAVVGEFIKPSQNRLIPRLN